MRSLRRDYRAERKEEKKGKEEKKVAIRPNGP